MTRCIKLLTVCDEVVEEGAEESSKISTLVFVTACTLGLEDVSVFSLGERGPMIAPMEASHPEPQRLDEEEPLDAPVIPEYRVPMVHGSPPQIEPVFASSAAQAPTLEANEQVVGESLELPFVKSADPETYSWPRCWSWTRPLPAALSSSFLPLHLPVLLLILFSLSSGSSPSCARSLEDCDLLALGEKPGFDFSAEVEALISESIEVSSAAHESLRYIPPSSFPPLMSPVHPKLISSVRDGKIWDIVVVELVPAHRNHLSFFPPCVRGHKKVVIPPPSVGC
ncbi:hypothetical protein Nepgr_031187 [Nepenthes gracilis]|uniref:Uncharacterized protein n=1 Tax=Nepenthes gracilis TaxID=150966 RepID=A0AAD3THU4_NEPGR|nr:hypothetical protein Nepgr_031187 [Nepenthes gracilis]